MRGLPRRCAPRNDPAGIISAMPRHATPTSHCEERSNPLQPLSKPGLPRRYAPRNDPAGIISALPRHATPTSHCEARSNPLQPLSKPGSPRRCAPRNDKGEPVYICFRLRDGCHCRSGCCLGLNRRSHDQIHPLSRRSTGGLARLLERRLECRTGLGRIPSTQRPRHVRWAGSTHRP
jgi:hypothetical protein